MNEVDRDLIKRIEELTLENKALKSELKEAKAKNREIAGSDTSIAKEKRRRGFFPQIGNFVIIGGCNKHTAHIGLITKYKEGNKNRKWIVSFSDRLTLGFARTTLKEVPELLTDAQQKQLRHLKKLFPNTTKQTSS